MASFLHSQQSNNNKIAITRPQKQEGKGKYWQFRLIAVVVIMHPNHLLPFRKNHHYNKMPSEKTLFSVALICTKCIVNVGNHLGIGNQGFPRSVFLYFSFFWFFPFLSEPLPFPLTPPLSFSTSFFFSLFACFSIW